MILTYLKRLIASCCPGPPKYVPQFKRRQLVRKSHRAFIRLGVTGTALPESAVKGNPVRVTKSDQVDVRRPKENSLIFPNTEEYSSLIGRARPFFYFFRGAFHHVLKNGTTYE